MEQKQSVIDEVMRAARYKKDVLDTVKMYQGEALSLIDAHGDEWVGGYIDNLLAHAMAFVHDGQVVVRFFVPREELAEEELADEISIFTKIYEDMGTSVDEEDLPALVTSFRILSLAITKQVFEQPYPEDFSVSKFVYVAEYDCGELCRYRRRPGCRAVDLHLGGLQGRYVEIHAYEPEEADPAEDILKEWANQWSQSRSN